MTTQAQKDDLLARIEKTQSVGATILSNMTQAKKIATSIEVDDADPAPSEPTPDPAPDPEPEPEPTPVPDPEPTPDPVPPATDGLGRGWELTADKVGLKGVGVDGSTLPVYTQSGHTVSAGTVIYRKKITSWYDLYNGGITIRQCLIQPQPGEVGKGSNVFSTWGGKGLPKPIIIEDCEFDGSLLTQEAQAWIGPLFGVASFSRCYIHHMGSGISLLGTGEATGSDVLIEHNYVAQLTAYGDPSNGGNHQSAFTIRDLDLTGNPNRQVVVRDNFFDCSGANATGAFFIQPNGGDVANVTASGNLLSGNGFNLILEEDPTRFPYHYRNCTAVNNRFRPTEYGPSRVHNGEGWKQWADNYLLDPSKPNAESTVVSP